MISGASRKQRMPRWTAGLDADVARSFRRSPVAVASALALVLIIGGAFLAPWLAPQNTLDLASIELIEGKTPPLSANPYTGRVFLLGTDDQGRDLLSALLYGSRVSLAVGIGAALLSMVTGTFLGLVAGYSGGSLDSLIMRAADVQLSLPPILLALTISGVSKTILSPVAHEQATVWVLILVIGLALWPQYARPVRSLTHVEKHREYVQAAQLMGLHPVLIAYRHILPNVLSPVLVIATLTLAVAVIIEATLSYLGVGISPTHPSLGSLIRVGQQYIVSGEWWMLVFPSALLALVSLSANLLGDWLRTALDPRAG